MNESSNPAKKRKDIKKSKNNLKYLKLKKPKTVIKGTKRKSVVKVKKVPKLLNVKELSILKRNQYFHKKVKRN